MTSNLTPSEGAQEEPGEPPPQTYLAIWGDNAKEHLQDIAGCLSSFVDKGILERWGGGAAFIQYSGDEEHPVERVGDGGKYQQILEMLDQHVLESSRNRGIGAKDLVEKTGWVPIILRARVIRRGDAEELARDLESVFGIHAEIYDEGIGRQQAD